jgi:hypothetical protein
MEVPRKLQDMVSTFRRIVGPKICAMNDATEKNPAQRWKHEQDKRWSHLLSISNGPDDEVLLLSPNAPIYSSVIAMKYAFDPGTSARPTSGDGEVGNDLNTPESPFLFFRFDVLPPSLMLTNEPRSEANQSSSPKSSLDKTSTAKKALILAISLEMLPLEIVFAPQVLPFFASCFIIILYMFCGRALCTGDSPNSLCLLWSLHPQRKTT